ncbi:MAG: hypothetical protein HOP29_10415 [Phycisphaerales bacterium]|nr:hypothetical protein [Phycisphaerales bacterium]
MTRPRADARPTFVVHLRPDRRTRQPADDPILRLRAALKVLLRTFGLRCVEVREVKPDDDG